LSIGRKAINRIETRRDRPEERRAGHDPPRPVATEGESKLDEADRDRRRHAHLPREHRVAGREHHGSEHAEDHREQGRGVDAERHRGDVLSPGAAHELQGQPRVGEVAGKNAERGPRHHALEHEVGRELEDADQQ